MGAASESILPLLIINLVFAVVALGIGFAAGVWYLGRKARKSGGAGDDGALSSEEQQLALERTALASSRLRDLATGVASDVSAHSGMVARITGTLNEAKNKSTDEQAACVATALGDIVDANEVLQERLAQAEQQIKTQAEEIRAHESEARTDSLTQLPNRRAFDDELNRRHNEFTRKGAEFCLLILDVDHFKKFNDTHGHQAGDEVLRQVARALEDATRDMDIACRYGGEEFAVVLPASHERDAVVVGERIRKSIEARKIEFEGKTLSVKASLGLAEVSPADSKESLLKRADEALYASKDAGRNQGHIHTGEGCKPFAASGSQAKKPAAPNGPVVTATLDGLPNRTAFTEQVRRRISEAERNGATLSVLAVEFVDYDSIRQEFGEEVAAMTLDSVAQFIRSLLREMDLLGFLGGSSLCVLLPGTDEAAARIVQNRAIAALESCAVPIAGKQVQLHTSMNVCELQASDSAASLIQRVNAGAKKSVALAN